MPTASPASPMYFRMSWKTFTALDAWSLLSFSRDVGMISFENVTMSSTVYCEDLSPGCKKHLHTYSK